MKSYLDTGSLIVIAITFILFAFSLFTQGLTHNLLIEAGILLVSVKLIMMNYKTSMYYNTIKEELKHIREILERNE